MSQVFWYGLQLAIIAGCVYAEHITAQRNGVDPRPGMALVIGVILCLAIAGFTEIFHEMRLSFLRWRTARLPSAGTAEEGQASQESNLLGRTGSRETLELPRSSWVRKEP